MSTSERLQVDAYKDNAGDYLIYLFHIVAYRWFSQYAKDKTVLDFGCGTGYGAFEISKVARHVDAVDIAYEAIEYANANYRSLNLRFAQIKPVADSPLPFDSEKYDLIISNQVIEHIRDPSTYIVEAKRVMRKDGMLVLATPDRTTRLFPHQKPWNRFHVWEYAESEMIALLRQHFDGVRTFGMTGDSSTLAIELSRTARLRLLTLPFTLPFVPEWWREFGLHTLKRFKGEPAPSPASFGEDAVWIGKDVSPSVNIIAEARIR